MTNDDEDWLLPPPKDSSESPKQIDEDSTIKELRYEVHCLFKEFDLFV